MFKDALTELESLKSDDALLLKGICYLDLGDI